MPFRVLLIYPNNRGVALVSTAIALLGRILKDSGIEVRLFDSTGYNFDEGKDYERLAEKSLAFRPTTAPKSEKANRSAEDDLNVEVSQFDPNLIAVSCTETTFLLGIKLIRMIQGSRPPVIFGGIFPTSAPEVALSFEEVDMVCVGEGEVAFPELCLRMFRGLYHKNIQGVWVKEEGGHVYKNGLARESDLGANPADLDFGLFDKDRFLRPMSGKIYRMLPLETARGCPFSCTFCNSATQRFRQKPMGQIRKELLSLKERWRAEYLFFSTDTFLSMSEDDFAEFCEFYPDIGLPFWIQTGVRTVTEDRLSKLKSLGLHRVAVGIENGSCRFRRKFLNKIFSNKEACRALQIIAEVGVGHNTNNIIGFPYETREIAMETIRLNSRPEFRHADTAFFTFVPFHGTKLRNVAVKAGFLDPQIIASNNVAEKSLLSMSGFSPSEIEGLRRCGSLYSKFSKSRWPEIQKAETDDEIFEKLGQEYRQTFFV